MRHPVLIALLFASACETQVASHFVTLNNPKHPMPARRPEQVQLFTSGHPEVPYVEVGVIEEQIVAYAGDDSLVALLAHMRDDGARYGCDAVVVGGDSEQPEGKHDLPGFWGTCIQYVQK